MSHRQERLESLFHQALELPSAERRGLLERAASDDAGLAAEVSELLEAHADAPSCLDEARVGRAVLDGLDEARPGARLGRYEILGFLGEGGMGSVHAARQLEPIVRDVAIKLIKPGMDTREVLARFESERNLLSRLHHPHIAGVLDAGATPRGRPFFVMEHVRGEPITRFADRRRLGLSERVQLMVTVADAIQHAHGQGVIHRDLKPGNVLVDELQGRPRPRVIDFGVAKVVSGTAGPRTLCTRQGQLIGTPGYMSPEQVAGDPVDARADVFSLGIMLYELLSGVTPVGGRDLRGLDDDAIRQRLVRRDIPAPSRKLEDLSERARRRVAMRRGLEPRGHRNSLRGDLDWIVLRALAPDPDQRYDSASALAADLRAALSDDPVSAGPPGLAYRLGKLSRRHRAPFAAAAALLLAVVSAPTLVAWWQSGHIERLEQQVSRHDQVTRGTEPDVSPAPPSGPAGGVTDCAACADVPAGESILVRNASSRRIEPGEVVALLAGPSDSAGLLDVVPAHDGSPHALLGSLVAGIDDVDGHVHGRVGPVAPGDVGRVITRGTLVEVAVDGPVPAQSPLGLSTRPGWSTVGREDGPLLGTSLADWPGPGPGRVLALVAPSWPRPVSSSTLTPGGVADGRGLPATAAADVVAQADEVTPGGLPGMPLVNDDERPGGSGVTEGGSVKGALTIADPVARMAPAPKQLLSAAAPDGLAGAPAGGGELELGLGRARGLGAEDDMGGSGADEAIEAVEAPPPRRAAPAVWHDVDGDGLVDVLLTREGRSRLLRQSPPGRFVDVTDRLGLDDGFFVASSTFVDLDQDGLEDLAALDAYGGVVLRGGLGALAFADRLPGSGLESAAGLLSLSTRDVDGDGRTDLVVSSRDGVVLYMNQGGLRFDGVSLQPADESAPSGEGAWVPASVPASQPSPGPAGT